MFEILAILWGVFIGFGTGKAIYDKEARKQAAPVAVSSAAAHSDLAQR